MVIKSPLLQGKGPGLLIGLLWVGCFLSFRSCHVLAFFLDFIFDSQETSAISPRASVSVQLRWSFPRGWLGAQAGQGAGKQFRAPGWGASGTAWQGFLLSVVPGPAEASALGSLLETKGVRPHSDPLSPNLHFNRIAGDGCAHHHLRSPGLENRNWT